MKTYEITFITKQEPKDTVKNAIESVGGKFLQESSLGNRQFTYPIKKENRGFYTVIYFEVEPQKLGELNRKLSLDDEILRHLIVHSLGIKTLKEGKVKEKTQNQEDEDLQEPLKVVESHELPNLTETAEKTEEEKVEKAPKNEKAEKPAAKKAVKEKTEEKEEEKTEEKEEKVEKAPKKEKPKATKAEEKAKTKIEADDSEERLAALDKKLDELLKD